MTSTDTQILAPTVHPQCDQVKDLATTLVNLAIVSPTEEVQEQQRNTTKLGNNINVHMASSSAAVNSSGGAINNANQIDKLSPLNIPHLVDRILSYLPGEEMWRCSLINATFYDAVRRMPMHKLAINVRPRDNIEDSLPHIIHMALNLSLHVVDIKHSGVPNNTNDTPCVPRPESEKMRPTKVASDTVDFPAALPPPSNMDSAPLSPTTAQPSTGQNLGSSSEGSDYNHHDDEIIVGILCRGKVVLEVPLSTLSKWLSKAKRVVTLELSWMSGSEHDGEVMRRIIHSLPKITTIILNIKRIEAMYYFVDSLRGKNSLLHLRLYADGLWNPSIYPADRCFSRYRRVREKSTKNPDGTFTPGPYPPVPPQWCNIRTIYVHKPLPFTQDQWVELLSHFPYLEEARIALPARLRRDFGEDLVRYCPQITRWVGSEFDADTLEAMGPVFKNLKQFRPANCQATNQALALLQKSATKLQDLAFSSRHLILADPMTSAGLQTFLESPTAKSIKTLSLVAHGFSGLEMKDVYQGVSHHTFNGSSWRCLEIRELRIQIKYLSRYVNNNGSSTSESTSSDRRHFCYLQGFYGQLAKLQDLESLSLEGYIDIEDRDETGLVQLAQLKKLRSLELIAMQPLTPEFFQWVIDTWSPSLEYLSLQYMGRKVVCRKQSTLPNMKDLHLVGPDTNGNHPEWYKDLGKKDIQAYFPKK